MTLDSLHKVMTGESTLDKEKQIGETSQRKDGLYKKVAPGKWAPVKAAGNVREFSETENHGAQLERQKKADAQAKKDEAVREQRAQGEAVGKSWKTAAEEWIKKNPNYKEMSADDIIKGISEHMAASEKPAEQQGGGEKANPYKADQDNFMRLLQKVEGKEYTDPAKVKVYRTNKGNWNVYYDGHRLGIYDKSEIDTEAAEELGWWERPAPDFDDEQGGGTESAGPNTAMQDERSQFKFRKHITHAIPMGKEEEIALNRISSYFESGKRNASDAIDNYADHLIKENMENGNNNEAQERAVMRIAHAIGYGHELHDKIKKARDGYDFGYDDEQGSFYEEDNTDDAALGIAKKAVDLAQRDYKDVPGRVLTADTKIRLSRIKREQTQDKTYNVGETSQRKDGLYKKVAPGKWAPVKAGGSAGAPAGGKAEVNPITGKPMRPEVVAYAKQKKAEAEQKRNTEKTAGGFTLAQNDKIKNAATDVIFKRRGEKLTPADLQREYKMSEPEANEASRRINEYFSGLEKDRQKFAKAGEKKAQNAKPQASPMAGGKKTYEGSGSTKGHKWEAEKVGDKYISTHTWPDGRTDKTEITQKDYETMRTTQGGKSEAPKKPKYDLKSNGVTEQDIMKNIREDEPDFDWGPLYRRGGIDAVLNEYEAMGNDPTALMYSNKK